MKIARFRQKRRVAYGVVEGDEVAEIRGSIFTRFRITDTRHKLGDLELLAPTDPLQIWCPGLNFAEHLEFAGSVLGEEKTPGSQHPEPWQKGRNALNAHEGRIVIPKDSCGGVHYEGEAVAVIGRRCRRVAPDQALSHVAGVYLRQRRQRARLAEGRLDLLEGQGLGHLRPRRAVDRDRRGPRQPGDGGQAERRRGPEGQHAGHAPTTSPR